MIDGADVSDEEPVFEIEPLAEVRGKRRERGEKTGGKAAEKTVREMTVVVVGGEVTLCGRCLGRRKMTRMGT